MFDPLTLGLIGSGIGALTGKNPLKGALLGGGLGAAGGYLATGGLLGAPTGGMAPAGLLPGPASADGLVGSLGAVGGESAPLGMMDKVKAVGEYAKPLGQAASAASSVSGLLGSHDKPIQAAPPMQQMGTGAQTLTALAGQGQQSADQQMQLAEQERAKRRQMYRGF